MCGRYAFYSPHEAVVDVFGPLEPLAVPWVPHWNITPSQQVVVIRARADGTRELARLQWGLVPSWAKERSIGSRLINARVESLKDKPAFRSAYRRRRCLLLADGYYEWQALAAGKQPYFVQPTPQGPFGMAGLWESWNDPATAQALESCVIVTTAASETLKMIHDRMPVIVPRSAHAAWLDPAGADPDPLAAVDAPELRAHAVSRRVNSPTQEGADLIAPLVERAG